jgi:CubicO group peptidase (beta-lactamase class C family)
VLAALELVGRLSTGGEKFQASHDTRADVLERQVRSLSTARLVQPVGLVFQYSNANWWPLGLIIQTVSGQPYDVYIQQHITLRSNTVTPGCALR